MRSAHCRSCGQTGVVADCSTTSSSSRRSSAASGSISRTSLRTGPACRSFARSILLIISSAASARCTTSASLPFDASPHDGCGSRSTSSIVSSLFAAAALALLVAVAVDGALTVAEAGVAVLALQQVTNQLRGAVDVFGEVDAAAPFLDDFDRFEREDAPRLQATEEAGEPLPALESLAMDNVSFTYPGTEHEVLHAISFTLSAGEIIAVVGENGSGKTTIAKILAGLYPPTGGTVRWNEMDRSSFDRASVRRSVSLVFQDFGRYEVTAHENIAFGDVSRLDDMAAVHIAGERAGVDAVLDDLPSGYGTLLSRSFEHGVELSGGQWQRVGDRPSVLP